MIYILGFLMNYTIVHNYTYSILVINVNPAYILYLIHIVVKLI